MQQSNKTVTLGRISGLYGVRGWVKVYSYTDPKENILNYPTWLIGPDQKPIKLETGKSHGKGVVAKLVDFDDRDQVAKLLGQDIATSRAELPELQEGEYYWDDLAGMKVVNTEKQEFGVVDSLFETGANAVMVVKDGEQERLIPFLTDNVILNIDLDAGVIEVDWPADF
ncbi:MAG: ribosome maturation factor RimM [Gammaproteobacteria bacterium]|nr:ribosome maturation factor RimM [Gammaproteobacteria bacterium]